MGRHHLRPGLVFAVLSLGVIASPASGQQPDSAAVIAPVAADSVAPSGPVVSPRGAFFRSLLLPGWGQAYADAPGRGAVYFALASGSFTMTYLARRDLLDAREEADWRRDSGAPRPDPDDDPLLARERRFEDWAAISVFLMFLSGADAYVSAYLADFEERVGVVPSPAGGLQLRVDIPVGPSAP